MPNEFGFPKKFSQFLHFDGILWSIVATSIHIRSHPLVILAVQSCDAPFDINMLTACCRRTAGYTSRALRHNTDGWIENDRNILKYNILLALPGKKRSTMPQDIEFSDSNLLKNIRVNCQCSAGRLAKAQAPRPFGSRFGSRSLTLLIFCHVNDVVAGAAVVKGVCCDKTSDLLLR